MAHLLAKQGEVFANGELIRPYLIAAVEEMYLEKINLLKPFRLKRI